MTNLSDIEAFKETKREHSTVRAINNSFTSGSVDAPSRTSKSDANIMLTVDHNVLMLVTAEDSDTDDSYERKDPCFGSCCDLVGACIFVDIFYIVKNIQMIITIVVGLSHPYPDDYGLRELDDDQVQKKGGSIQLDLCSIAHQERLWDTLCFDRHLRCFQIL
jgi:hypothetical protein